MRPPFRYFGGKARLARWITGWFPEHYVYLEPFCGSAAVLLAKRRCAHEIINDADRNVVTFYRMLRDRPDDLARACALTPYARDELAAADLSDETLDDLERARRFYVRSMQGFSGVTGRSGWSITTAQRTARASTAASRIGEFAALADRLSAVSIENADALSVIDRYATADAVIYADPPYLAAVREASSSQVYRHEMADEASHQALADALNRTPAFVVLSGYLSPSYERLYPGWHRIERRTFTTAGNRRSSGREVVECLWFNRPPAQQLALPGA